MKWKYKQIMDKGNPMANKNGIVLEHRLVMSKHLGRPLISKEIVHHLDGDPTNNDINNLQLSNRKSHPSLHHKRRKIVTLTCSRCGIIFNRYHNQISHKKKT